MHNIVNEIHDRVMNLPPKQNNVARKNDCMLVLCKLKVFEGLAEGEGGRFHNVQIVHSQKEDSRVSSLWELLQAEQGREWRARRGDQLSHALTMRLRVGNPINPR